MAKKGGAGFREMSVESKMNLLMNYSLPCE
jgi:hypothetical protein